MARPSGLLAGILLTVLACAILASMDSVAKVLTGRLPVIEVLWARYFFHALAMAIWLSATSGTAFLKTKRPVLQLVRGLTLMVGTICMYLALSQIPLATATSVQFFSPVLVTVLSVLFLGERIGLPRVLAVLAGFGGVLLIIRPGYGALDPYVLFPLGAAVVFSIYFMLTRELSGPEENRATLFNTTAIGSVFLTIAVLFVWQTPTPVEFAMMLAVGCLGALGHFFLVWAFSFATAATLSPFLYAQVFFASLSSTLVLGDPLQSNVVGGALVLVASGVFIWWRENYGPRRRAAAAAPEAGAREADPAGAGGNAERDQ